MKYIKGILYLVLWLGFRILFLLLKLVVGVVLIILLPLTYLVDGAEKLDLRLKFRWVRYLKGEEVK